MRHEETKNSIPPITTPPSNNKEEIREDQRANQSKETVDGNYPTSVSEGSKRNGATSGGYLKLFQGYLWVVDRIADKYERVNWSRTSYLVTGLIKFLLWGSAIAFTTILAVIATDLDAKNKWLDWEIWKNHWYVIAPGLPYAIGLIWQRYVKNLAIDKSSLHRELQIFYERMGFKQHLDADIRCTLWMPPRRYKSGAPDWLTQATDYYPVSSPLPGSRHQIRQNRGAGRSYKVYRKIGNNIEPEGIIGWCAVDSISEQGSDDYIINVPEGESLVDCLVNDFNYTPRHAKRVTSDRLSFMCIALLNRGSTKLLGVLYCDSRKRNAFNKGFSVKAEGFLRDIVKAMSAD